MEEEEGVGGRGGGGGKVSGRKRGRWRRIEGRMRKVGKRRRRIKRRKVVRRRRLVMRSRTTMTTRCRRKRYREENVIYGIPQELFSGVYASRINFVCQSVHH